MDTKEQIELKIDVKNLSWVERWSNYAKFMDSLKEKTLQNEKGIENGKT